jgi:hypothetical protein
LGSWPDERQQAWLAKRYRQGSLACTISVRKNGPLEAACTQAVTTPDFVAKTGNVSRLLQTGAAHFDPESGPARLD